MKIPADTRAELEAATPPTEMVQERVRTYLEQSQIPMMEFARRVNRGASALRMFLAGTYISNGISASDVLIRRDLVAFMDAHPLELQTYSEGKLYETSNVAVMRQWFDRCLERREMAGVYGPPGAQKTFVFGHLVAEHNRREIPKNGHGTRAYAVYCSQGISPRELLRKMCRAAMLSSASTILGQIDVLRFNLSRRKSIFVLDEAQHLGIPALEIVRELNDCQPHCGILLAGSHKLYQTFHQRAAELEQWNSRIANFVELPGIAVGEAVQIIEAELGQLPTNKIKFLLESCLVVDGFSKKKHKYYSARRLFRQIADLKADPRFVPVHAAFAPEKESAA